MSPAPTAQGTRRLPRRLWTAFFLMGFVATATQVLLLRRLLGALYGNEMIVGVSLAVWMAGTGAGSLAAGAWVKQANARWGLGAVVFLSAVLLPLTTLATYGVRAIQGLPAGQVLPPGNSTLICAALLLPLTALMGAMFVLFSTLDRGRGEERVGLVYLLEAAGAAAGGVASGIASTLGVAPFAWCFAACAGFVSIIWLVARGGYLWRSLGAASLLMTGVLVWGPGNVLPDLARRLAWPGQVVLASAESRYASLVVTESDGQRTLHVDALPDLVAPDPRQAEMTVHSALLQHPSPKRILIVGGGLAQTAREAFKHGVESIDYVQIDPAISELEREYLGAGVGTDPGREAGSASGIFDDRRVSVYNVDGRMFLNETSGEGYDVIIVSTPDPASVLINRFYTLEFFKRTREALNPGGVIAFSCAETENYVSGRLGRLLGCVSLTLGGAFSEQRMLPLGAVHFVASDSRGWLSTDGKELSRRLAERGVETSYMREYYLGYDLSEERVDHLSAAVERVISAGRPKINRDRNPVAQQYYLAYWYDLLGSKLASVLELAAWRGFPLVVPIVAAFIFAATAIAGRRGRHSASAAAVLVMGFSTLTAQIVLLIALQTYRGHLFHSVGLVVAAFMVGLAAGAAWWRRRGGDWPAPPQALLAWHCLVVGAVLMLPVGRLPAVSLTPLAAAASLISGALGGAVFQSASYAFVPREPTDDGARGAGLLNACDHLGAALGALAAASLLLPALGLPGTAALAAAAAGGSAAGLWVGGK